MSSNSGNFYRSNRNQRFGGWANSQRDATSRGGGRRAPTRSRSSNFQHQRPDDSAVADNSVARSSTSAMEIDGFYFDAARNRYFKVLPTHLADNNYTSQALKNQANERRRRTFFDDAAIHCKESCAEANCTHPTKLSTFQSAICMLPRLALKQQLGNLPKSNLARCLDEKRIRKAPKIASTRYQVLNDYPDVTLDQCQFLDVSPDGKNALSCWSVRESHRGVRIMCNRVDSDPYSADELHYGLKVQPTENFLHTVDRQVMDICQAKIDSSVTCVLYVTVPAGERGSQIFLHPLPEMSNICDQAFLESPVYNAHWSVDEGAWSCAWEPRNMRVSLGLERCGMVMDVVKEKDFRLYSRQKNVLTQRFTKDGNLLFMGLRGSDVLCCDLRLSHHHTILTIPQTSTCCVSIMKDTNYLLAANFFGEVKLWDLRQKRVVQEFLGLKNSHTKTPIVLTDDETAAFVVGEDGTTVGWSLKSGDCLCSIAAPYPVTDRHCIPKMCYSNRWAGRHGNAALALGVRDELHFYELTLH